MMDARNLRRSLSPLHAELEALLDNALYDGTMEDDDRFFKRLLRAGEDNVYTGGLAYFPNPFGGIREE